MKKRRISNVKIIAGGYFCIALIGTILLMLPFSSASGEVTPFLTAFFTSVSASCVTGLVLVNTATYWSLFGQLVILVMIQLGGLGFMTVTTFFLSFSKKNLDIRKRSIMAESINTAHIAGLKKITRKIFLGTALFEFLGAIVLSVKFIPKLGFVKGIYYGIFHSISAFCNAGFDLMGTKVEFCSLTDYSDDIVVNMTIMTLITVGGIGFLVWDDILKNRFHVKRYSLHTKLVLSVNLILTFGGAILFYLFERDNLFADENLKVKVLGSLFSSVTCRTAGFNTLDFSSLTDASVVMMSFLMFVGGSSGSTAGGIKTTTLAVICLYLVSELRGIEKPRIFGRSFENGILKKSVAVAVFNLTVITSSVIVISAMHKFSLTEIIFEVFSAMGTVGMTMGITGKLNVISKIILIILMYTGRVGSISFALALLEKKAQPQIKYPCEAITVG